MNWFLLLLILKLFTNIWAAPIDLLEAKDDFQVDQNILNGSINNNLNGTIEQADTLLKTAEDEINSTFSHLSESLNENAQKTSADLQNFTAERENVKESNFEKVTTEQISEVVPTTEVNGDQISAIKNSDTIISHEETKPEEISLTTQSPVEISTEIIDAVHSSSEHVMPADAESRNNEEIILSEPAVTEFVYNDVKSSMEEETVKDVITIPTNVDTSVEPTETSVEKTDQMTENNLRTLNALETEQVSTDSENNVEHTTQASNPETTTPNTPTIVENLNENVEQIYNLSEKLVENFLDKAIEDTGNLEQTEISASNQESTSVNDLGESYTPTTEKISSTPIEINNNVDKQSTMEETTYRYPVETSSETPALKETVDSFINQVTDIGSSIGKAADELRFDASMIHAATENLINPEAPVVMQENMTEPQEPLVAEHEDNSEQAPTFKEAVDSFIEEVVEIGSKLGLIPEEKPVEEIPTTTEPLSELINIATTPATEVKEAAESTDSSTNFEQSLDVLVGKLDEIAGNLEDNKTDTPVVQIEDKTEEVIMTTPASLENLAENQNNNSELAQNSENSNFGRSVETLIEAGSEIGSNFGQTVSNLFSTNKSEQETATDKPNESVVETTGSAEQNNEEDSEISSTQVPIVTFQGDFPKYSIINHENIEVSSTTPAENESITYPAEDITKTLDEVHEHKEGENFTQQVLQQTPEDIKPKEEEQFGKYESFSQPAEDITKTLDELHEHKEDIPKESENYNQQVLQHTPEEIKHKKEEQSAKYAEYIPVAVITIPEAEVESIKSNDHSEPQLLTNEANETVTEQEPQASQGEESIVENKQLIENTNSEQPSQVNEEKGSENPNQDSLDKTEEFTTLAPMSQETTTTNSPVVVLEETTHALNKFENTLKTLIEQEKLKYEESHATALETNQQETTTLAPSTKSAPTHQEEPATTTTQSLEETTMLPKKFEEELQMAVKALEETTHHHFEEFQNNLKEAFKKFTVWGAEHERPETTTSATTTIFKTELNEATVTTTEAGTTQQTLSEQHTTMMPDVDDNQDKTDAVLEESFKTEEPHRIGVINQNFVDKFADNYIESPVATSTEMQMVKEQSSQLSEMPESVIKMEQTTETPIDLTTMLPVEEEIKSGNQEQEDVKFGESFVEVTTINNDDDVKEALAPMAENIVKESSAERVKTTTEYIAETTPTPLLAHVTLQKDLNSVSLVPDNEQNTVAPIQEPTALHSDSEQIKEIHTETTPTTEAMEEAITQPTFETSLKEMVTFIEHKDTTTVKQQEDNEEDSVTTMQTQTQEPLTQAAFMEEQQQQLESTTEHDAQTQTVDASGQTATTTTVKIEDGDDDDTYKQETTETDIHSTTVVEEDEMATTTVEPTAAPVEPEARSLSLPPPKLEYLQNEDGVEVFYGYSIVKHN
ncbi:probable GPI-anchored adhesin-like protein PGA55 [Lucilia sericata]|uniref:probable GPI-anchored adhesin-like protein PGA55 n=1 Tax=Lucilia sericata TaxID=13632 RepID=UPI0018A84A54|nr:probable GPI-anchored adhesin-like protein PGA55 [Lucilia sericata]